MLNFIESEKLWVERYRPQTIDECILPKNTKDILHEIAGIGEK